MAAGVFAVLAFTGPPARHGFALAEVAVNLGFALVNTLLGLAILRYTAKRR